MSAATALLEDVLSSIRDGDTPDPEVLLTIDAVVREEGASLSRGELVVLMDLVNNVQSAIAVEKASIQSELDRLSSERRAIRGYASLRSHRHSQRINRTIE